MARLLFGLGVAAVIFTIYAVADCAFFDRMRIRGLSRGWWIVVIIFVPIIGPVLWFIIGRGRRTSSVSGGRGHTVAPDDDTDFLRRLGQDTEQDERIRRLEQELAELDSEADTPGSADDQHPAGPGATRPDNPETPGEAGPSGRPNA
ncbi:PLDc N-terminal domain-containing protein [Agromyces humatus]|uniref:Cardiolipin synthase N-terminal domain-containing protein n=1 Tax=Agromyces humatus TaxID=279573 RepID=A0ABN2L232_9MICO|nr:PLDc N-terminal domain-containing protein [Agromyces humatus]